MELGHQRPNLMDAERADGSKVMLKRVDLETEELDISLHVSSKPLSDDPRNVVCQFWMSFSYRRAKPTC